MQILGYFSLQNELEGSWPSDFPVEKAVAKLFPGLILEWFKHVKWLIVENEHLALMFRFNQ